MLGKPYEFWVALLAATAYVVNRNRDKPLISRLLMGLTSAGLGYALAHDLAAWSGFSDTAAAVALTAFGQIVLDVLSAVIADRQLWIEAIRKRLGGTNGGNPQ